MKVNFYNIFNAFFIFLIFFFAIIPFVSAINDLMTLQGNVKIGSTNLGSGNLTIYIFDSPTSAVAIWNSTLEPTGYFNNSIVSGKYDVILGNSSVNELNLEYGRLYYFEMYVNTERLSFNGSTRQVFQSTVGQINGTFINPNQINSTHLIQNIDLSNATKIQSYAVNKSTGTSFLGEFLDSIIDQLTSRINTVNSTVNLQNLLNSTGIYSTYNLTYESTYNQTYESIYNVTYESTFNSTYALYAYNQTIASNIFDQHLNRSSLVALDSLNVTNILRVGNTLLQADSGGTLNVTGTTNFNGGWNNGGVTIRDGQVFVQTLFVVNITSLGVSDLYINGSLIPSPTNGSYNFNNTFDVGNLSTQWRNGYFGTNVYINSQPVALWLYNQTTPAINDINNRFYNSTFIDQMNATWTSTYNATYASFVSSPFQTTSTTIYNDTSGVNVGIGTSSPSSTLEVVGGSNISSTAYFGSRGVTHAIIDSYDSMYYNIDAEATGVNGQAFIFGRGRTGTSSGTELARITDGGRLGLGIASPNFTLHSYDGGGIFTNVSLGEVAVYGSVGDEANINVTGRNLIPGHQTSRTARIGVLGISATNSSNEPNIGVAGFGESRGGGGAVSPSIGGLFAATIREGVTGTSNNYGIYISNVTGGASNYGIYQEGGTQNYFSGSTVINSTDSFPLILANSVSGQENAWTFRQTSSTGSFGIATGSLFIYPQSVNSDFCFTNITGSGTCNFYIDHGDRTVGIPFYNLSVGLTGTNRPSAKLHVNGTARIDGNLDVYGSIVSRNNGTGVGTVENNFLDIISGDKNQTGIRFFNASGAAEATPNPSYVIAFQDAGRQYVESSELSGFAFGLVRLYNGNLNSFFSSITAFSNASAQTGNVTAQRHLHSGGNITIGSSASSTRNRIDDGTLCIGAGGCTAPTTDGRLLVEDSSRLGAGVSTTAFSYNYIGTGSKAADGANINNISDLFIQDSLEVDGTFYLTGGSAAIVNSDIAEVLLTERGRENTLCEGNSNCVVEPYEKELDYGDLVCINPQVGQTIEKCTTANSHLAVGFVSDTAAIKMGNSEKYGYPIALAGVVNAKVTNENGNIMPGDLLVSASKPGYAMKSDNPKDGTVVGKAYDFCDEEECKMLVFVALS